MIHSEIPCLFRTTLLLCALFLSSPALTYGSDTFGLLYIQANTAGASGGHGAIRIGHSVFHFQQFDTGFFRLVRQPWDEFLHVYNDIENRPVFYAETAVPRSWASALEMRVQLLLLSDERNFSNLSRLRRDLELQEALAGGRASISVPCLGFFRDVDGNRAWKPSLEAERLKTAILRRLGPGFFSETVAEFPARRLNRAAAVSATLLPPDRLELVPRVHTLHEEIEESVSLLYALRVLDQCVPVDSKGLVDAGPLLPSMMPVMERFGAHLEDSVVRLLRSARPGRGKALLLQAARYQAVRRSIDSGRLMVLDVFPDQCQRVSFDDYRNDMDGMERLEGALKAELARLQQRLSGQGFMDEADYSVMEDLGSKWAELRKGLEGRGPVRIMQGRGLPAMSARVALGGSMVRRLSSPSALRTARSRYEAYFERLRRLYSYNILRRNCITELAWLMEGTVSKAGVRLPEVTPVPFVYFDRWLSSMDVTHIRYFPSFRRRALEKMYRSGPDLAVYLRECNTITSSVYRPHHADTSFLFFTDDIVLLRPIYGGANVAYGAMTSAAGLIALPFDRGRRLLQGVWGVVYSLPELFMWNIRKGSFLWVPPP